MAIVVFVLLNSVWSVLIPQIYPKLSQKEPKTLQNYQQLPTNFVQQVMTQSRCLLHYFFDSIYLSSLSERSDLGPPCFSGDPVFTEIWPKQKWNCPCWEFSRNNQFFHQSKYDWSYCSKLRQNKGFYHQTNKTNFI